MTYVPPPVQPPGVRFRDTAGRIFALTILAALTLCLLTATQISTAFLKGSGAADGVSAVSIRSAADVYAANRRFHREARQASHNQRRAEFVGLKLAGDAEIYSYAHSVAFRRHIFGCYPAAYDSVRDQTDFKGRSDVELDWRFLSALYREAAKTSQQASPSCAASAMPVDDLVAFFTQEPDDVVRQRVWVPRASSQAPSHAIVPAAEPSRDHEVRPFANCTLPGGRPLECLWTNATTAVGMGTASQKQQAARTAALNARLAGLQALDAELAADKMIASPEAQSAVAAWLELHNPDWINETPVPDGEATEAERSEPRGVWSALGHWLYRFPARFVAGLVMMPVLAQSAALAMLAGALGGGVASLWESVAGESRVGAAARALAALGDRSRSAALDDVSAVALREEIARAREAIEAASEKVDQVWSARTDILTSSFLGSAGALIVWLLTTGGLFVLSGGEEAGTASPNVLMALALVAGLARQKVIDLTFSIADRVFTIGAPPART